MSLICSRSRKRSPIVSQHLILCEGKKERLFVQLPKYAKGVRMVLCKRERRRWKEMISFVFCLWSFFDEYKGQKRRRWQRNYFVLNVAIQPRNRRNRRRKQNNDDDGSLPIPLVGTIPRPSIRYVPIPTQKSNYCTGWISKTHFLPLSHLLSSCPLLSSPVLCFTLLSPLLLSSPLCSPLLTSPLD